MTSTNNPERPIALSATAGSEEIHEWLTRQIPARTLGEVYERLRRELEPTRRYGPPALPLTPNDRL